jgi:lambda family phage tail tape measure protein
MADAKKQAEALAIVQDNLARISQQYNDQREDTLAGIGHGQKYAEEAAGMRDIQRQYDALMARAGHDLTKGTISQGTYDQEVAQYEAALDQQLSDQQEFYRQRDVMQGDWKNGAIAAMEDWRDAAANTSSQVADMVTDAANNMTDAFV